MDLNPPDGWDLTGWEEEFLGSISDGRERESGNGLGIESDD